MLPMVVIMAYDDYDDGADADDDDCDGALCDHNDGVGAGVASDLVVKTTTHNNTVSCMGARCADSVVLRLNRHWLPKRSGCDAPLSNKARV